MIGTTNYVHDEVGNLISIRVLNLGLTIEQELPGNLGGVTFLTMYSWQDEAFAGFVDAEQPRAIVDSYGLLNMRLEWSRIFASRVSAAVFFSQYQ